jgi:CHASE1-domain containing sensor protein
MPHWLSETLLFVAVVFVLLVINIYYETHRRKNQRELLEEIIARLNRIEEKLDESAI